MNKKIPFHKHHTIIEELLCHLPYAIFSVALSLIILSILSFFNNSGSVNGAHRLFHSLHFLHLIFAGTGAILTFRKYSKSVLGGLAVGLFVPIVFCTLSDAVLPYFGGRLAGLEMTFHWCFISHLPTVLPFLLVGVLNGWAISSHTSSKALFYSSSSHFIHIFVSSMASVMYLVSFGFDNWADHMGFVFIFLIVAVLTPCTLSDIVMPLWCARIGKTKRVAGSSQGMSLCCAGKEYEKN